MDYVYGQINEKASKAFYTGEITSTAETHVDNSSMTIFVTVPLLETLQTSISQLQSRVAKLEAQIEQLKE